MSPLHTELPTTSIERGALIALLAPTLGDEKSSDLVNEAAKTLGYWRADKFTIVQATAVLELLGKVPGLVGVAARFALRRAGALFAELRDADEDGPKSGKVPSVHPRPMTPNPNPPKRATAEDVVITEADLVKLLESALGEDKAREVVAATVAKLKFRANAMSRREGHDALEAMTTLDGIVGTVARFALARFALRYPV